MLIIWGFGAVSRSVLWINGVSPLGISEPYNSISYFSVGLVLTLIWFSVPLLKVCRKRRAINQSRRLEDLQILPSQQFEALMAAYFEQYGHRAFVIGRTGDHGVDLLIHAKSGEKWIVQCKRWKGVIGESILRDLYGTMHHENAHRAFLMTTGTISSAAITWSRGKPITFYDGKGLVRLLKRLQRR